MLSFYNATKETSSEEPNNGVATKTLCQTTAPEEKRDIIGNTFFCIVSKIVGNHLELNPNQKVFFNQNTLKNFEDLIEKACSLKSSVPESIKMPHNETELVKKLVSIKDGFVLVEPLKDFHKDEVHILGRYLRLPKELLQRHSLPMPGLAVRIICANEPYIKQDFFATTVLLKAIVNYSVSLRKVLAKGLNCFFL